MATPISHWLLEQEARALLTRLGKIKPFALHMTMVSAAGISPAALTAIETHMTKARRELNHLVQQFLGWLQSPAGQLAKPSEAQRRFTFLRMRFNAVIAHFDIFADVIVQRSEHETGVWVAGLDAVATDALRLRGSYFKAPPLICYVDRGQGAAIRRARTRLPGGGDNPVAIIRIPRERMVSSGIASSLVHEVGHQAAALLDLVNSLRPVLRGMQENSGEQRIAWQLWERWLSEIVADFWSVAKVGIAATMGLMGVVSLPRAFVFRVDTDDPHPIPWMRMKLSCAMGQALYPHPQWANLARLWGAYYPPDGLDAERRQLLSTLAATMPGFVALLKNHRPPALRGQTLPEVLDVQQRQPAQLAAYYRDWGDNPMRMRDAPPTLVFAVIGQARADGRITPEAESRLLTESLTYWATRTSLDSSALCAAPTFASARIS
jgi:hypothetical protein